MFEQAKWYALTVQYQHERQTEKALRSKGLETLVPLYRSRRQWSDRVKDAELPLFAGYVLCHFDLAERIQVLNTPGVYRIVAFGGEVVALEDSEVAGIRRIVALKLPLAPWPYLKAGDRVKVEHGPPLLGFAEPLQMATAVDGVLVVARAGKTTRKAVATVLATLNRVRAKTIGLVLNEVHRELSESYYYYDYYRAYYRTPEADQVEKDGVTT